MKGYLFSQSKKKRFKFIKIKIRLNQTDKVPFFETNFK